MSSQLLPQRVDNTYRGGKLALWLFALVVFVKAAQGLSCIFNGYATAIGADGIPLDTYPPDAAGAVLSVFARYGLVRFMFCLLGILVFVRYRALIPLMFALLLLEYLGGRLILQFVPMTRAGTPIGSYVNLALAAVMIVGLVLSQRGRRNRPAQE